MELSFATKLLARVFLVSMLLSTSSAHAATPTHVLLVSSPTEVQNWVVYDDRTTHWLNPGCAAQLQTRSLPTANSNWTDLQRYSRINPRLCADVIASLREQTNPEDQRNNSMVLMQIRATPNEGWVRYRDNTRHWVGDQCLRTLKNRGITTEIKQFTEIETYPLRDTLACDAILDVFAGGSQPNEPGNPPGNTPGTPFPSSNRVCIGMNDDFAQSWDGGSLVADAFKQAKGPVLNDYRTISPVDSDGWPTGYQEINFVIGEGDHDLEKNSTWVLLPYDQSGVWISHPRRNVWQLEGASHAGFVNYDGVIGHRFYLSEAHINLKISAGSIPTNSRNRWHMVPETVAARYARAMRENGFRYIFNDDRFMKDMTFPLLHPNARRQMADFCRIRFMLGDSVNSLGFTGFNRDRSRTANPTFRPPNGDGIPYEWEVWIANHLQTNIWHVDHVKTWEAWNAGDGYLREQARYFATHLRGNVIREYGNEIWNTAGPFFPQTNWVTSRTPYANSSQVGWKLVNNRYGRRAWDTAGPWVTAFAGRRGDLDNTVGIHTGCPACVEHRLRGPDGQSFGDRMDSVSGTFYIGQRLVAGTDNYRKVANNGFAGVDELHRTSLASLKVQLGEMMSAARPYVSRWHMYEGGSHMNFPSFQPYNNEYVRVRNVIEQYWKSAAFTRVLGDFKNWWTSQGGSGELMWFNLYGLDSPDNPFGYYTGSHSQTARHAGIGNFVRSNR